MKIIGIENSTNMDKINMENDINARNFMQYQNKCKILHTYANSANMTTTALVELPPDLYKHIREHKNKVFIGHQCCRTFDLININPCFNCGRYGHNGNKCTNNPVCLKCSEDHKTCDCKSDKIECANCDHNNKQFRTSLPTDHLPTDRIKCAILKNKTKKYINSVSYPLEPTLPTMDAGTSLRILINQQIKHQNKGKQIRKNPLQISFASRNTTAAKPSKSVRDHLI